MRGPDLSGAVLLPSPRQINPLKRIDLHFRNAIRADVLSRRLAQKKRDQKKGGRTWAERNTKRNPKLLLRLSG
jgi:hypothetical protein